SCLANAQNLLQIPKDSTAIYTIDSSLNQQLLKVRPDFHAELNDSIKLWNKSSEQLQSVFIDGAYDVETIDLGYHREKKLLKRLFGTSEVDILLVDFEKMPVS